MSLELEAYRGFITELWHIQQVNEEDIVSRLEEEYNLTTDFSQIHTCLEQWNFIPSPSPIYSYQEEPSTATQNEEQKYNALRGAAPQQMKCYHNTYSHESNMLPDNLNTGPTPLERYAQEEQTHELLALRLAQPDNTPNSTEGGMTPRIFRSVRIRRGEKGKKKRGGERSDRGNRGEKGKKAEAGESGESKSKR